MKFLKHPFTYIAIGGACLLLGIVLDVQPDEPAGIVFGCIIAACILAGIAVGLGLFNRK